MDERALPERTRVVVLIDSLANPGGGESLAVQNALRLDPSRFDRTLVITRWTDEAARSQPAAGMLAELEASGVRVIGVRRRGKLSLSPWLPLLRLLRKERVHVIHGHMFGSNVWASILGSLARVPAIVAHEHMWSYDGGRARALIDRELIARLADAFVAVSAAGERMMVEREGIDRTAVVMIPNGAIIEPGGDGAAVRAELGIPTGTPVVGAVGHLRAEKAYEVLIEAAGRLRGSWPSLRVLIAGEGDRRPALESLVGRLGLGEVVQLLGARDDVPDLLQALDVAVCCSDFEGGPLSVMEYMGAGRAVVATDVGGLPELVEDGVTGSIVPPRDPAALAGAIGRLLATPDDTREMGRIGQARARERYGIDGWVARIEALYAELLP